MSYNPPKLISAIILEDLVEHWIKSDDILTAFLQNVSYVYWDLNLQAYRFQPVHFNRYNSI